MKYYPSKLYLLFSLSLCLVTVTSLSAAPIDPDEEIPEYNEEEVLKRLQKLSQDLVEVQYVPAVKGYIKGYVIRNRKNAEIILVLVEEHIKLGYQVWD